jgi:hypothetical protein
MEGILPESLPAAQANDARHVREKTPPPIKKEGENAFRVPPSPT